MQKKIKMDHNLALELWKTKNSDARILATKIVDINAIDQDLINKWIEDISYYALLDEFSYKIVAKSNFIDDYIEWTNSEDEWKGRAGWNIVIHKALYQKELNDDYFYPFLTEIEKNIKKAKNRKKQAMNNALISIGMKSKNLEEKAIALAEKLGKIEVDHGETSCKTPFAKDYIIKARNRNHKSIYH